MAAPPKHHTEGSRRGRIPLPTFPLSIAQRGAITPHTGSATRPTRLSRSGVGRNVGDTVSSDEDETTASKPGEVSDVRWTLMPNQLAYEALLRLLFTPGGRDGEGPT